jgi:hypothetical protein
MLLQGLLDRGDAPKDQQTFDWEYAHIVVQDPFVPLEVCTLSLQSLDTF